MALNDYQFGFRGLTFGLGTSIKVLSVEGLEDIVVRSEDEPVPRGDGDVPGLDTLAAKEVRLELAVTGVAKSQTLADLRQEVLTAFTAPMGDAEPFSFREAGVAERFVYVRVKDRTVPRDPRSLAFKRIGIRAVATDPRIYSADSHNAEVGIYSASGGGTDFDKNFPVDFSVDGDTERIVRNAGDGFAYPMLRFYGPRDAGDVDGVKVTNTTTGQVAEFDAEILAGQILTANMRRIVSVDQGNEPFVHIDGSNRYGSWQLPRRPFYLAPGDNVLRYELTGASTSNDAPLIVSWRDTWH